MVALFMDFGKKMIWKDTVAILIKKEVSIWVSMFLIKNMAMGFSNGKMEESIKGGGLMGSNMA